MASRNSENDAAMFGLAMAMMIALFAFLIVYFALAAYTAVVSLLCLFALFRPLKIGKHTITPKEARWFLGRGIVGWFAFPFLVITIAPLLNVGLKADWMVWLMLTGYMIGALGGEYIRHKLGEQDAAVDSMPPQTPPAPPPVLPQRAPKPFHYARWDDEEAGRK